MSTQRQPRRPSQESRPGLRASQQLALALVIIMICRPPLQKDLNRRLMLHVRLLQRLAEGGSKVLLTASAHSRYVLPKGETLARFEEFGSDNANMS